jgi:hypothetical protein
MKDPESTVIGFGMSLYSLLAQDERRRIQNINTRISLI